MYFNVQDRHIFEEDKILEEDVDEDDEILDEENEETRPTSNEPQQRNPQRASRFKGKYVGMQNRYGLTTQLLMEKEKIMNEHGECVYHSYFQRTLHAVFGQQMSAKKGMEKYGEIGLAAVVKEFTQLSKGAVPEQNKTGG
jgi:hypothetical protein